MKIGIVTQPLKANYGGILQNWALQQVLLLMGHEPITIDYMPRRSIINHLFILFKTLLLSLFSIRKGPLVRYLSSHRFSPFSDFVKQNIIVTRQVHQYKSTLIREYNFNALIVGSDQVWRPRYNKSLKDMYLSFAKYALVRKIAYAASFGIGENGWEYTESQTRQCRRLASKFNAISVRERSGIKICQFYLGMNAVHVLDPTLLLTKNDYARLCENVPVRKEAFIAIYELNKTKQMMDCVSSMKDQSGLSICKFSADLTSTLTVEEWLSMFRDAVYIITDSFHGTVFSLLFEKPFISIGNHRRGLERFQTLLEEVGLIDRLLIDDIEYDYLDLIKKPINWEIVRGQLTAQRVKSFEFLKKNLL